MAAISLSLSGSMSDRFASDSARRWADSFNGSVELPAGRITFTDGSGSGNVNRIAVFDFSINAAATQSYDLQSGQTDVLGRSLVLTALKFVYIELSAATTGSVWFGPQNVSNSVELWFDGIDADARQRVKHHLLMSDPDGYTIDTTHKVISLTNSTGSTVTGTIVLAGVA
jgi:hypothetical protein